MTKKQLEARVDELEKKIAELTSQVLTLSLRPPQQILIPAPVQPVYPWPNTPTWPPHYPYVGDPIQPTITYGSTHLSSRTQAGQNIQ